MGLKIKQQEKRWNINCLEATCSKVQEKRENGDEKIRCSKERKVFWSHIAPFLRCFGWCQEQNSHSLMQGVREQSYTAKMQK